MSPRRIKEFICSVIEWNPRDCYGWTPLTIKNWRLFLLSWLFFNHYCCCFNSPVANSCGRWIEALKTHLYRVSQIFTNTGEKVLVFESKTIELRHGCTQVFFWLEFVNSYPIWSRLTQDTWDISASIQRPRRIRNYNFAYVQYIKILTWLRGLRVKIENFSRLQCPQFPEEAWAHRKLRACLHGSGRPQAGEVTRLGGVTRLSI